MLKTSTFINPSTIIRENKQYELEYKALLNDAIEQIDKYNQNMYKAYAFLWEKCSQAMQNKISARSDFVKRFTMIPSIF